MLSNLIKKINIAVVAVLLSFGGAIQSHAQDNSVQRRNKDYIVSFYTTVMNDKDIEGGIAMMGPRYTQHNPTIPDGKDGFRTFFEGFRKTYPNAHVDVKRAIADGNYVILHSHFVLAPNTPGVAVVDIFRLEDGKPVEHWDVIQPMPESAVHSNGMF